ncbi:uncharacterized protein si:ch211-133n4.6 isoform X1 [Haplochromis burtoni]|uniref:uncharacterized protein si:ch211-133n4.6 isoform X1 n=1 Tax=Haplochromis burtoni TaxID=8153 RepID=UPI0003BD6FA0|nr:uncharacterized protein si:ch211-133n4.6 isoform X1 [Haplochromis burtoni]
MLNRNVVLLFSLFIVLVEGDIDSSDAGIHATSTDKDSTSDEAPTESINAIYPDHPDESHYYGGGPSDVSSSSSQAADLPVINRIKAPEPAVAAPNSVEEEDDDSEESGKKKSSSRLAKPRNSALNHQSPDHAIESPALPPQPVIPQPVIPQPIIPQPKTPVRSRTSKRRSRNNRRQI